MKQLKLYWMTLTVSGSAWKGLGKICFSVSCWRSRWNGGWQVRNISVLIIGFTRRPGFPGHVLFQPYLSWCSVFFLETRKMWRLEEEIEVGDPCLFFFPPFFVDFSRSFILRNFFGPNLVVFFKTNYVLPRRMFQIGI